MEARYLTEKNGNRLFVILGIEEYEPLREMEDEMKDVRRFDRAMAYIHSGEDEVFPWEQSRRSGRAGYLKTNDLPVPN